MSIRQMAAWALASALVVAPAPTPREPWSWPTAPPIQVVSEYVQPAHRYGAGHRGVDLASGPDVYAPADGIVAFSGSVAGRHLITIAHAGGFVTTLEPVESALRAGDPVSSGDIVGTISRGGHAPSGTVHWGMRLDGKYINPLTLVADIPAAILLPCCA